MRFIEERLATKWQIFYSTHSPFMIQPGRLERVRLIEDHGQEEGAKVTQDVLTKDEDTLFPLQSALGYDLAQHLFIAPHNLVVEGTSDYTYLVVISDYLKNQAGRTPWMTVVRSPRRRSRNGTNVCSATRAPLERDGRS